MRLTDAFSNYGMPLQTWHGYIQISCEISVFHTATISDITLQSVRSQQLYTPSIDWHRRFEFDKPHVHVPSCRSVIQNFIEDWLVTFLNRSLTLPSDITIYYKLQNTKWSDEIRCAQKIPVFPLMCYLQVREKIYRAACSTAVCCRR